MISLQCFLLLIYSHVVSQEEVLSGLGKVVHACSSLQGAQHPVSFSCLGKILEGSRPITVAGSSLAFISPLLPTLDSHSITVYMSVIKSKISSCLQVAIWLAGTLPLLMPLYLPTAGRCLESQLMELHLS